MMALDSFLLTLSVHSQVILIHRPLHINSISKTFIESELDQNSFVVSTEALEEFGRSLPQLDKLRHLFLEFSK